MAKKASSTASSEKEAEEEEDDEEVEGSDSLESLMELASASEEFVMSLRVEVAAQQACKDEQVDAARRVERMGMRLERISHDGDCLFACAHKWLQALP